MHLVFAGTPQFAVPALRALLAAGHDVRLVLTQPDRPAGRGLAPVASPIKQVAEAEGLPVHQPTSLRSPDARAPIAAARPDALVVVAYGLILPQAVLDIPCHGAINIHASLLPRWRGAAPIQRALLAGDAKTGVCIMRMDAGLDTGPVLLREAIDIGPADTAAALHDRLAALGGRLIVEALDRLERGTLSAEAQPAEGATYAAKIEKSEARIDWSRSAAEIDRQVRAFNPSPGAVATFDGIEAKVWKATPLEGGGGAPGTIVGTARDGIVVACGAGRLCIEELQRPGARRLDAAEFLRGTSLPVKPGRG